MKRFLVLILLLLLWLSVVGQVKLGGTAKLGGTVKTAVQAAGGPSNFVSDTFTETSDTVLSSHTPETGGAITLHTSYASTLTVGGSTDTVFPDGTAAYWYNATPPSADYFVQCDITRVTSIAQNFGCCGHMDTAVNSMVCARANPSNNRWELLQISSGTSSTLAFDATNWYTADGQTRTVKLTFASGGTTAAVAVSGTTIIAATATTVTAAGKVGMRGSGAGSTTTGLHVDNLTAQ